MSEPRKIAIYNQKGGAGKSTSAANISVSLTLPPLNRRVLALELDKQGNLAGMLGQSVSDAPGNMTDVFQGRPLADCVTHVSEQLDLVVGDSRLADVEFNLANARRREEVLTRQLEDEISGYDYVILDCPPNQGLLAVNAVVFADEVVAPVRLDDANSVNGLGDLLDFLDGLSEVEWTRPLTYVLRLDGDPREDLYETLNDALEQMGLPVAPQMVRRRAAVGKSIAAGSPIVVTKPGLDAAVAFREFAETLDATRVGS